MPQLTIQCPNCLVQHPVAAIPPAGTYLRCNNCEHAFATQSPDHRGINIPRSPDPFDLAQLPAFLAAAASQPLLQRPQPSSNHGTGWEPWMIFSAIGGGAALLVLLMILGSMMLRGSGGSSPDIATNPVAVPLAPPTTPAPVVTTPAAPPAALPAAASSTYATSSAPPMPTVASSPAASFAAYGSAGASPSQTNGSHGGSPSQNLIRQLTVVQDKPQFSYTWKPGEKYRYGFEVRTEANETTGPGGKLGVVEYQVAARPSSATASSATASGEEAGDGAQQASGTAFVVHSDGLLVTCHHVVAGAAKLKVHVSGKVYPADVVAVDKANDLAVIRIDATGLPALPLGNSDQVQLSEDVKAVGYPLSDVLGQSVKVTSGTIAGKVDDAQRKVLQVDIAINPGNSGGPLVNGRGEVVGVNSAGLFGSQIQEVSFAVPSNLARNLLDSIGVSSSAPKATTTLSGVDLAAKVTPSTVFVQVELGSESAAMLEFTGNSKSVGSTIHPPQQIASRVAATLTGELLGAQNDLPLGFGLGTFASMIFEKLPEEGQKTWEEKRVTPLSLAGSTAGGQQVVGLIIEERIKYEIKSVDDEKIVVSKHISCEAVGQASTATVRMTADGTWTFDRRDGVPLGMEMTIDSHINIAGKGTTQRGTVRYERLKSNEPSSWQTNLEKELASIPAAADESELPRLPELRPLALEDSTESQVSGIIRQLKGKKRSFIEYLQPLDLLARVKPIERRRNEVSTLLHNLRTELPTDQMSQWIRAVTVWGTEKNVPTLLVIIDTPNATLHDKVTAIEALGHLPATKAGAELLARLVPEPQIGMYAVQSLAGMGSVAEKPSATLLQNQATQVRMMGCLLLAHVGTELSVPAVENYLRGETDPRCRAVGEAALKDLRRKAAAKKEKSEATS